MAHPSAANVSTSRLPTLVNFDHYRKLKRRPVRKIAGNDCRRNRLTRVRSQHGGPPMINNSTLEFERLLGRAALALFTENGSTGAAIAFPSLCAIASTVARPIRVCPPFTFCGPRCSVPPL